MNNFQIFLFINACRYFYPNTPYQNKQNTLIIKLKEKKAKNQVFQEPDQVFDIKPAHPYSFFQQDVFLPTS